VQEIRPAFRHQPAPPPASAGDKLHLDEVFVDIQGVQHYLWPWGSARCFARHPRAGTANAKAAKRFFKRLLKGKMRRE
jgi:transposase-like protein